jgi:hypothetical protein
MPQVSTLGIDTAKQVFQLHGVDAQGNVVLHKRVTRKQLLSLLVGAVAAVPRRPGSLWRLTLLGPGNHQAGTHGETHGPAGREAVCARQ